MGCSKNIRNWDDLNMSIYGRCLPQFRSSTGPSMLNPRASGKSQTPTVDLENFGVKNILQSSYFSEIKTHEIFYYDNFIFE